MKLEGRLVRLRAVEPDDAERLYMWENDPAVWEVSGTLAPFSRHDFARFVEEQRADIYRTGQQRLMIDTAAGETVGTVDLFEFDARNRRAGIGILIYDPQHRNRGYASEALRLVAAYARETLDLHQLWCTVGACNGASLALFRKAGYKTTGIRREWNLTPRGYEDELLLQLPLDTADEG